jgi:N-methylhydantoinase A
LGAMEEDLEIEIVECQEFNMVRQYYNAGKNIRVKVQIKPGLIAGYKRGNGIC